MHEMLSTAALARAGASRAVKWAIVNGCICVAGALGTAVSYSNAQQQASQTGSGSYTVWSGAIAIGGFFCLRQMYRFFKLRRIASELEAQAVSQMPSHDLGASAEPRHDFTVPPMSGTAEAQSKPVERDAPAPALRPAAPPTAGKGWYPDPHGEASWRWWDGASWTNHTG
jgi:hypothetical protein